MSACCSSFTDVAGRQFDSAKVAEELRAYRTSGPGPTTRLLRDGIVEAGAAAGSILDVGAGFGPLTFELLDRGMTGAIMVDASSACLNAAAEEAARRDRSSDVRLEHGDFLELAPRLPAASAVTLDRVVCCYPFVEPLLVAALEHAERALALSYPRDLWYVRWAMWFENLRRRLAGNTFRTFVHSPLLMDRLLTEGGFDRVVRRKTWMWAIDVYARAGRGAPAPSRPSS